jgi:hypothetical protein
VRLRRLLRAACRTAAVLGEVDDHGGDVVDPARVVRGANEAVDGLLRILDLREHRDDLIVAHHSGQAVRAQQEPVAVLHRDDALVDLHVAVDPERAGQDAAMRVVLGLGLGDLALDHHPADQGVVLGQRAQLPFAEQVRARVADVREPDLGVVHEDGGERGAHPGHGAVLLGARENGAVRLLDLFGERALVRLEQALDGLEGEVRRHLPAAMTAHPVGDRVQGVVHEERVLVALTDLPDVRRCPDDDPHRRSSSTVLPTLTTSPAWTSTGEVTFRSFRKVPFVDPRSSTNQAPFSPYSRACT